MRLCQADRDRIGEARLLALDDPGHARRRIVQFRIGAGHLVHHRPHHLVEERLRLAEQAAVANGAADDLAQHVAAAFVGGQDTIADEERRGTRVVGDDAQRAGVVSFLLLRLSRFALFSGELRGALDERHKQIGVVVADHALQHRRDALQACSGVDRRLGQGMQHALGAAVELHEDQVPDLDVAAALAGELALSRGALRQLLVAGLHSHVVMDLRAGSAGSGVAHLPEVFLHPQLEDALGLHTGLAPQVVGFAIALHPGVPSKPAIGLLGCNAGVPSKPAIGLLGCNAALSSKDGDVELGREHGEPLRRGHQLPCVGDGLRLEVVAEAEVAEHLEECVVAVGEAHVFEVVVLASGAHALLRAGGAGVVALLGAQEDVLELVHARIGEQQGGVVGGEQRGAVHLAVPLLDEKVQKHASNVVSGRHRSRFRPRLRARNAAPECAAAGLAARGKDDFNIRAREGSGVGIWSGNAHW